jgi:hypothetical protein
MLHTQVNEGTDEDCYYSGEEGNEGHTALHIQMDILIQG